MALEDVLKYLNQSGLLATPTPKTRPLAGGVSSDIWLIDDGARKLVLKQALPKLRVAADWFADPSRNRHEQEFLEYVGRFLPAAVPRLVHGDPERGFFLMEYLGPEFANWKGLLLAGQTVPEHARQAAEILAAIHRYSWQDADARARFATVPQFRQLRLDPYLVTTGERHPPLRAFFHEEAERLANTQLCLVHGDFSPKNILVSPERMVLLDCEVAWFGDPVFDVAFLLNHLFLKALYRRQAAAAYLNLAHVCWQTYRRQLTRRVESGGWRVESGGWRVEGGGWRVEEDLDLEERLCRLLPMLMLARVDGKSPVEYLTKEEDRERVRKFASESLFRRDNSMPRLCALWSGQVAG